MPGNRAQVLTLTCAVLDRATLLNHLSSDRRAQLEAFVSAARPDTAFLARPRHTKMAIIRPESRAAQRRHLRQLAAKDQAELNKLTAPAASSTPVCPVAESLTRARPLVRFARPSPSAWLRLVSLVN